MTLARELTLGFVPIARTTFDIPLAESVTASARALLTDAGYTLVSPDGLVTDADATTNAVRSLDDQPLDLVVVLQSTFADSTMLVEIAQNVDAPLLLWAVPEESTGGRLRLNSFCGVNLGAHALKRAGITYDYLYAQPDDTAALDKIGTLARAGYAKRLLRQARIGRVGEHPAGFDTCRYDEVALQEKFGVSVVPVELTGVFAGAQAAEAAAVDTVLDDLRGRVTGLDDLNPEPLRGTIGAYTTMRQMSDESQLHGMAVRCWPEFFTEMGCAACGGMSMLSDGGIPASCEADVNGTITQYMLQCLSGEPAFGSDIVAFDTDADHVVLWHCGLAPLSMADPDEQPGTTLHSNRHKPLLFEFALKPGRVTLARLSEASGEYRLVVAGGEMQKAPRSFGGTTGVVRFDRPAADVLDTLLNEGLEHHIALTYGDFTAELTALANMLRIPVLRI